MTEQALDAVIGTYPGLAAAASKASASWSHQLSVMLLGPRFARQHRRYCTTCNPGCAVPPLPIDGREYRRRRRARKRR